ncbi:PAS domain-containing protein, partial [Streptomyces alkaliterrae]
MSSRPSRGAARLAAILDALPDALLLVNANGTVVNANSIALDVFETPGTALIGRGLLDLLPAFDSRRIPGSMRRPDEQVEGRQPPTRMVARRTDGTEFPVEVTSANLEDGRTPYESAFEAAYADHGNGYSGDELLMLVVRDLAGTLDTEAELARQQRQTEMILRAAAEGVVGTDTEGRVVLVNPAAAQILGYRASDLGGRHLHPLVHHTRPDGTPQPYEETPLADTLRSGRKHRVRRQVLWAKDGRRVPVDMTTAPVRDGDQLVGAVLTFTDRRAADALETRHAQLLSVLDQALRGPLEQLRTELTGLAADPAGQLWPEANQTLHHLSAGYSRMTTLIDNVVRYQRLDTGREKLDRKQASLDAVIAAGVEGAVELIGPGRAQFAVHAPPIQAEVDAERLALAIAHLVADVAGVDATGTAPALGGVGDSTIVVAAARRGGRKQDGNSPDEAVVRVEVRGPHGGGSPVHLPIAQGVVELHGGVLQTHEVPGAAGGSAYVLEVPVGEVTDVPPRTVAEDAPAPGASGDAPGAGPGSGDAGGGPSGGGRRRRAATALPAIAAGPGSGGEGEVPQGEQPPNETTIMPLPSQPGRGTAEALALPSAGAGPRAGASGMPAGPTLPAPAVPMPAVPVPMRRGDDEQPGLAAGAPSSSPVPVPARQAASRLGADAEAGALQHAGGPHGQGQSAGRQPSVAAPSEAQPQQPVPHAHAPAPRQPVDGPVTGEVGTPAGGVAADQLPAPRSEMADAAQTADPTREHQQVAQEAAAPATGGVPVAPTGRRARRALRPVEERAGSESAPAGPTVHAIPATAPRGGELNGVAGPQGGPPAAADAGMDTPAGTHAGAHAGTHSGAHAPGHGGPADSTEYPNHGQHGGHIPQQVQPGTGRRGRRARPAADEPAERTAFALPAGPPSTPDTTPDTTGAATGPATDAPTGGVPGDHPASPVPGAAGDPTSGVPAPVHPTPGNGTPAAGTPDAATPTGGTPAAGSPAAGTPAAGSPAVGTPDAGTPGAGTPVEHPVAAPPPDRPTGRRRKPNPAEEQQVAAAQQQSGGVGWSVPTASGPAAPGPVTVPQQTPPHGSAAPHDGQAPHDDGPHTPPHGAVPTAATAVPETAPTPAPGTAAAVPPEATEQATASPVDHPAAQHDGGAHALPAAATPEAGEQQVPSELLDPRAAGHSVVARSPILGGAVPPVEQPRPRPLPMPGAPQTSEQSGGVSVRTLGQGAPYAAHLGAEQQQATPPGGTTPPGTTPPDGTPHSAGAPVSGTVGSSGEHQVPAPPAHHTPAGGTGRRRKLATPEEREMPPIQRQAPAQAHTPAHGADTRLAHAPAGQPSPAPDAAPPHEQLPPQAQPLGAQQAAPATPPTTPG